MFFFIFQNVIFYEYRNKIIGNAKNKFICTLNSFFFFFYLNIIDNIYLQREYLLDTLYENIRFGAWNIGILHVITVSAVIISAYAFYWKLK